MKTNVKSYILIFSISVTGLLAKAQQASSNNFSLQQAIEYAYKNSPNNLNAQSDILMAKYKRKEVLGIAMPQINGSVDLKDFLQIPTSLLPGQIFGAPAGTFIPVKFGTKYQASIGASASLLVFSADYIVGLKATKEYISLMNINVTRTKTETVNAVAKAYYGVLVNKERIKLFDINLDKLSKLLNDTKALNKQGFVELIDVERLEVANNNLITEKQKIQNLITLSENVLKFQMGYSGNDNLTLTDSLSIDDKAEAINVSKIELTKRPEYQLLEIQQNLYTINIKRLQYGYLPSLVAYGSFSYSGQRNQFDFFDTKKDWFPTGVIGGTLSLNIFDGLQRHYKIQQAKLDYNKGANNLKNFQLAVELETSSAIVNYNNAISSLQVQKRNLELAKNIYAVSQKKYEQGVGSNLEVINAQASLKESQTNYFNAVYDMLVYKTDYLKATGTLVK